MSVVIAASVPLRVYKIQDLSHWHDCCIAEGSMSFLDMQDLATVAAQVDLGRLLIGWCADNDLLLGLIEGSVVGGLLGSLAREQLSK